MDLNRVRAEFAEVRHREAIAEEALEELLPEGKLVSYKKGNMKKAGDALVRCVSGRRIKICSLFSKVERWIDLDDIESVRP